MRIGRTCRWSSLALVLGAAGCTETAADRPEIQERIAQIEQRRKEEMEVARRQVEEKHSQIKELLAADGPATDIPVAKEPVAPDPSPPDAQPADIPAADIPAADTPPVKVEPPVPDGVPTGKPAGKPAAQVRAPQAPGDPWQRLRTGMGEAELAALLGPPTEMSSDFYLVYWHYGRGRNTGRLALLSGSKRVIAWDPPTQYNGLGGATLPSDP